MKASRWLMNIFYITTNNGLLIKYNEVSKEVDEIKTGFKKRHDIEGLTVNAQGDKLLFACKNEPYYPINGDKGVFAFNLETQKIDLTPYLAIKVKDLVTHAERNF